MQLHYAVSAERQEAQTSMLRSTAHHFLNESVPRIGIAQVVKFQGSLRYQKRKALLKEKNLMRVPKVLLAVFFGLCLFATLFPPFLWGEELFQQDISYERKLQLSQYGGLPVKSYSFLFGASKQKLYSGIWLWNEKEKRSEPFYVAAQRKLLVSELLLEYVIALILAALLAFLVSAARWTIGALEESLRDKNPSQS